MNGQPINLKNLVKNLSGMERLALLQELLAVQPGAQTGAYMSAQLLLAERWFWQRARQAATAPYAHSRGRMWIIFMLLRYGALKIKEILALTENDCQFRDGFVRANGRTVPFSPNITQVLETFWTSWPGRNASKQPFFCDCSQIRRSLGHCAKACAIEPGLLSARALRHQRGLELEAGGLHPRLIALFLGKSEDAAPFGEATAMLMIQRHLLKEDGMKTSARNVFRGPIVSLMPAGILTSVTLETPQGIKVTSIITQTSCENLNLAMGAVVNALIKAPWVTVLPESQRAAAGLDNCFQGTVQSINKDPLACEIQIALPQGNQICSLYANGTTPDPEIRAGSSVFACFSPFSVILTVD